MLGRDVMSQVWGCEMSNNNQKKKFDLMSFIQGKTIHGLGQYCASQAVEHSSQGILGKNEFYRVLEKGKRKQGRLTRKLTIPHQAAGPVF